LISIDYPAQTSLPASFFEVAERIPNKPFLWGKQADGKYHALTYGEVASQVQALASALIAKGLKTGDRVMLVSESRPEWFIADFAIMSVGAISVPAYTTNTIEDHTYVMQHCAAKAVIVSNDTLAAKVVPALQEVESVEFLISMDMILPVEGVEHHLMGLVMQDTPSEAKALDERLRILNREDTACLIYTSGTGGDPKGVMLSHGAILKNCEGAHELLAPIMEEGKQERFLSFLPLSHSYEHTAGLCFPMTLGAQIYYAEGLDKLGRNMAEASPTIMTAVPRLYESMKAKIEAGLKKKPKLVQGLFRDAVKLGTKRAKGQPLTRTQKIENWTLNKLVRRKVKKNFGGSLKAFVSGGGPLTPETGYFFDALGVNVCQGYGQTEAAPVTHCNPPQGAQKKMHTVGPAFKDVEVKIAKDGEILIKGENVMQGYWGDKKKTKETIVDGWLYTGDVGEIDEDGYLTITDRKKDIIVNTGGDNIAPQRVEGKLTQLPEIEQAMVYGDKRPYLTAVIVAADGVTEKDVQAAVRFVNEKLSKIETVRKFILAEEPFTQDNDMMTPTLKLRRHKIKDTYGKQLDALYTSAEKKTGKTKEAA